MNEKTVVDFIDILSHMTLTSQLQWARAAAYNPRAEEFTAKRRPHVEPFFSLKTLAKHPEAIETLGAPYGGGLVILHRFQKFRLFDETQAARSIFMLEIKPNPEAPHTRLNRHDSMQAELVRLYTLIDRQLSGPQDYLDKFFADPKRFN